MQRFPNMSAKMQLTQ